jgi:hypothetical protein
VAVSSERRACGEETRATRCSRRHQQINGRSWTEVLDDEFADGIEPLSKPISELADDGWIWRPSRGAYETFAWQRDRQLR